MNKLESRKNKRKLERQEKKQKKNVNYQRSKGKLVKEFKVIENDSNNSSIKEKQSDSVKKTKRKRIRKTGKSFAERQKEKVLIQNEEREIRKYERLLRLKSYTKRNKLPKSFYIDGLGDLIDICDNKTSKDSIESVDEIDSKINKKKKLKNEEEFSDDSDKDMDEHDDDDNEDETFGDDSDDDSDEDNQIFSDDNESGEDILPLKKRKNVVKMYENGHYEDIYGFIRDGDGNIVNNKKEMENKHDEEKTAATTEISEIVVDESLQRRLRGLLNRLTSSNIKVISGQIMELYKTNSRYVVNKAILNCIENVVINYEQHVPCKLVSELCMLIAILYNDIGEEIGGFFVHSIICLFDSIFNKREIWQESKKLDNIIVLILNMNVTGLLDSQIVYDILDKFCEAFSDEKSIELIDLILKASGFLLRKDDPARMKALILKVQSLSSDFDLGGISGSRIKFIHESLTLIKNNNVAKLKSADTLVLNELIESTLKGVIKKARVSCLSGLYATVIQSSHWFSFTKTIVPLNAINEKKKSNENCNDESFTDEVTNFDDKIDTDLRDKLCKALRINTPLRKQLFTVLFLCNDYLDAAYKLISIGKKQFSEVINLVLHVAINEKVYNKFYFHLLKHLATCDRKYKLALNFAIRDKIIQVESLSKKNQNNLATLIFELLQNNTLPITCLKVVQFSDINEVYVTFIRNILEPVFAQDDKVIESILSKIPKKDNFASAIKLFITCFMGSDAENRMSSVRQLQMKLNI